MRFRPRLKGKLEKALGRKLAVLIQKTLRTKTRATPTYLGRHKLTKGTGNLFGSLKNIKPQFKMSGGDNLNIEVDMMEYYQWLDAGTEHIEGWFFSEEIMDSRELGDIADELLLIIVDDKILDIQSKIKR